MVAVGRVDVAIRACDRREDARRVGTTQLTFVRDALGDEWMAAVVLTRVGELRRDRDPEAAPGQARYSYDVEYRAATEKEIAAAPGAGVAQEEDRQAQGVTSLKLKEEARGTPRSGLLLLAFPLAFTSSACLFVFFVHLS